MSWFGDLFSGGQSSAEADANYQRQLDELNAKVAQRSAAGTLTEEQRSYYSGNQAPLESVDAAAAQGLAEGAMEGLASIPKGINSGLSGLVSGIFSAIPLKLWLVGAVVLFVWMGGLGLLKGRLNK